MCQTPALLDLYRMAVDEGALHGAFDRRGGVNHRYDTFSGMCFHAYLTGVRDLAGMPALSFFQDLLSEARRDPARPVSVARFLAYIDICRLRAEHRIGDDEVRQMWASTEACLEGGGRPGAEATLRVLQSATGSVALELNLRRLGSGPGWSEDAWDAGAGSGCAASAPSFGSLGAVIRCPTCGAGGAAWGGAAAAAAWDGAEGGSSEDGEVVLAWR